jgi:hypothetical protein
VVELTVEGNPARASTDTVPPAGGTKARPLLRVPLHETVRLRWSVKNASPGKKLARLLVHLFVVRESKAGQKEVPDPAQGSVWESALATALEPGKQTRGVVEIPIDEAGIYLARVESQFTEQDHEHFAALDLQVQ